VSTGGQITLRQERLADALLDPKITTKTEALLKAGYAKSTAFKNQGRVTGAVGTEIALARRRKQQADKARGLRGLAERLLSDGEKRLSKLEEELSPLEQIQTGAGLLKLARELGDTGPDRGEARAYFVAYLHKAMRRSFRAGFKAALEGRDPLGLVVSQQENAPNGESAAAATHDGLHTDPYRTLCCDSPPIAEQPTPHTAESSST